MTGTDVFLDSQAVGRVFEFGTTASGGEALLTLRNGTAALTNVNLDVKGSASIAGSLSVLGAGALLPGSIQINAPNLSIFNNTVDASDDGTITIVAGGSVISPMTRGASLLLYGNENLSVPSLAMLSTGKAGASFRALDNEATMRGSDPYGAGPHTGITAYGSTHLTTPSQLTIFSGATTAAIEFYNGATRFGFIKDAILRTSPTQSLITTDTTSTHNKFLMLCGGGANSVSDTTNKGASLILAGNDVGGADNGKFWMYGSGGLITAWGTAGFSVNAGAGNITLNPAAGAVLDINGLVDISNSGSSTSGLTVTGKLKILIDGTAYAFALCNWP